MRRKNEVGGNEGKRGKKGMKWSQSNAFQGPHVTEQDPLCYKVGIDILTAQTRKWRPREAKYLIDRECAV